MGQGFFGIREQNEALSPRPRSNLRIRIEFDNLCSTRNIDFRKLGIIKRITFLIAKIFFAQFE